MKNHELYVMAGSSIDRVAKEAKEIAIKDNVTVEFDFNGITVLVDKHSNTDLLYRDYCNALMMEFKTIGVFYREELPKSELDALKARRIQLDKETDERNKAWKLKDEQQQKEFNEKVGDSMLLVIHNKIWMEYIEKNQDPYGKCAVDYARDWGRLMQYYMGNGETLAQCADRASHELGWYGISGFMYGAAVQMLSQVWKYGEELRKWHNKNYGHEGDGVINPAILTIES